MKHSLKLIFPGRVSDSPCRPFVRPPRANLRSTFPLSSSEQQTVGRLDPGHPWPGTEHHHPIFWGEIVLSPIVVAVEEVAVEEVLVIELMVVELMVVELMVVELMVVEVAVVEQEVISQSPKSSNSPSSSSEVAHQGLPYVDPSVVQASIFSPETSLKGNTQRSPSVVEQGWSDISPAETS